MAACYFCLLAALCAAALALPAQPGPAPPRLYQHQLSPSQLQSIGQLDYYVDNRDAQNFYSQQIQKQGNRNESPARLETLEPDSEVELIPGAQQPQQPPQQTPVSPGNGIVPGRVFIVHMPVPGYRPGTIGGYQPVYVVAAAPQGNMAYAPNGYQNAVLLNPSGQVLSPFFGYPGLGLQQPNSLLLGAPAPLQYQRDYEQIYQGPPGPPAFAYGPPGQQREGPRQQGAPAGLGGTSLQFAQLVNLQGQQQQASNGPRTAAAEASSAEQKRVGETDSAESKEASEAAPEQRRNARPASPQAHARKP